MQRLQRASRVPDLVARRRPRRSPIDPPKRWLAPAAALYFRPTVIIIISATATARPTHRYPVRFFWRGGGAVYSPAIPTAHQKPMSVKIYKNQVYVCVPIRKQATAEAKIYTHTQTYTDTHNYTCICFVRRVYIRSIHNFERQF